MEVAGPMLLLLALLWVKPSQGLECFQCVNVLDPRQCHPVLCPLQAGSCPSAVATGTINGQKFSYITKGCGVPCAHVMKFASLEVPGESYPIQTEDGRQINMKIENIKTTCCEGNLCNEAARVWPGLWGLAVRGLLLSLGTLLWALL
ncbi:lymphocyte antigen 6A-2/6E-1-like [Sapajus apella]|uniref:Lymphocyte antigen 6A-2/6E-1-like n=1 Tax=Sapajus apella TaxID=9515 RepID=A0A6J3FY28_SAPAP|nr:lymphocyte antigen 6A-2/6E-1-like [Sapajus apella]